MDITNDNDFIENYSFVPVIIQPMTEEELTEQAMLHDKLQTEAGEREALRNSALAKLSAIGLTVSEIESLGI
jgi:hypothetical protein